MRWTKYRTSVCTQMDVGVVDLGGVLVAPAPDPRQVEEDVDAHLQDMMGKHGDERRRQICPWRRRQEMRKSSTLSSIPKASLKFLAPDRPRRRDGEDDAPRSAR